MANPTFQENRFWLNNTEVPLNTGKFDDYLNDVKSRASLNCKEILKWKIHVCSESSFTDLVLEPEHTSLVCALAALYKVEGDISGIVRRGSGGACRSTDGGWVRWNMGLLANGEDSVATQIAPASHWPQIRVLVLVVRDDQKKTSSITAMKQSVQTSEFLKYRAENIVSKRTAEMVEAIKNRNFENFALLTMRDSNQFHSVCLDTHPPCFYMNDTSRAIVEMVLFYNEYHGLNKVAYTFDAGPNAFLYVLENDVDEVLGLVNEVFPPSTANFEGYFRGCPVNLKHSKNLQEMLKLTKQTPGSLEYIICTKIGDGPKISMDGFDHLLTKEGLPHQYFNDGNYVKTIYRNLERH